MGGGRSITKVIRCFLLAPTECLMTVILLTSNLKDFSTHLYDIDACLGFLGVFVDHTGTLGYRRGDRLPSFRAQSDHASQFSRINDSCVETLQALEEDLDVFGQAIPSVDCLGFEGVPGLARHDGRSARALRQQYMRRS